MIGSSTSRKLVLASRRVVKGPVQWL